MNKSVAHSLSMHVNGVRHTVEGEPGKPLVDLLREDLGLLGTHVGCRNGDCGACTVLIEGEAYKSCILPSARAENLHVETLDGLSKSGELHPVQRIFWGKNAFQCGFCLSGHILCLVALFRTNPHAGKKEIEEALAGNLCRCTGYQQILAAALSAARELQEDG
jgi:aerobic-type carbon monoxide dehydrogenase small subunit (CoxS/CutS family)